jgi:Sulfotransferase domain
MSGFKLIAGSGRSGTTWVQDALATANRLRPVFEPLHPYVTDVGKRYAHRALSADDDRPDLQQFFVDINQGHRDRFWTSYRRQLRWLFPPPDEFWTIGDAGTVYRRWQKFIREIPRLTVASRHRDALIKCIRANLMLGWLTRKCGFKVVLVVRHPAAVIESELRASWNAKFALDRFREDERLDLLTAGRYRSLLGRPLSHVEALTARWIVENQWVVEAAPANGVEVVYYERLRADPDVEWKRIGAALGVANLPAATVIAQPSQQTSRRRSAIATSTASEPRWMRALSAGQLSEIQGVLDDVEYGGYSVRRPDPVSVMGQEVDPPVAAPAR